MSTTALASYYEAETNTNLDHDDIAAEMSHLTTQEIQDALDEFSEAIANALQANINQPVSAAGWLGVRKVYQDAVWYAAANRLAMRKWGKWQYDLVEGTAEPAQTCPGSLIGTNQYYWDTEQ